MMSKVRFAVGDADADLAERLDKEISDFNAAVTGHHDARMLSVAVRGDDGDLRGGLYGWTWGGCGYIDLIEMTLARLSGFGAQGVPVPLALADHWMPGMTGTEFLARVKDIVPTSRRGLLISWGDPSTTGPILEASALGRDWHPALPPAEIEDGPADRVGSVRVFSLAGGHRETLTELDDQRRRIAFTFADHAAGLPVRSYTSTITARPVTATGRTYVEWSSRSRHHKSPFQPCVPIRRIGVVISRNVVAER
jgi:Polyketide cyclase / dehydrase and lipid transport